MTATMDATDVQLIRWPADAQRRDDFRRRGVLRLLVIEGCAPVPISPDLREDWVRAPIAKSDLQARIASLRARCDVHRQAHVDPNGVLRYCGRFVTMSPTATDLLERLVREFGVMVSRDELSECLPEREGDTTRNALDLHVMRLRKRIQPVGLTIRTVWGRGYLLEPMTPEFEASQAPHGSPA